MFARACCRSGDQKRNYRRLRSASTATRTLIAQLGVATRDRGQPVLSSGYVDALEHLSTAVVNPAPMARFAWTREGLLAEIAGRVCSNTWELTNGCREIHQMCGIWTLWPNPWDYMRADALEGEDSVVLLRSRARWLAPKHALVEEATGGGLLLVPRKLELAPRTRRERVRRGAGRG